MTLPLVHLSGTPFAQGEQHGRALRERIAHNLRVYFDRFEREAGVEREEVLERARLYRAAIGDQNADYYAGMKGIAQGSGFSLDEIVALNVRYEILYYNAVVTAQNRAPVDGCTAFALAPDRTESGHLLLGQNWDWIPEVQGALLHTTEATAPASLAFTEAGIFGGKIGFNSAGLGLAINGITSMDDNWSRLSKPFHVRCYEILRQRTFEAAVAVVQREERACSGNFLIAQTPDQVIDLEAAPDRVHALALENGCVVHTNHFVDPEALSITEPDPEYRLFSCRRMERMQSLLGEHTQLDIPRLQELLQDHANTPKSICRHERPEDPIDEQYRTVTSVIMDLTAGVLHVTDGPPCQSAYVTHRLPRS